MPPVAPEGCGRGIGAEFLMSNKSPMRGPKSFGGFHLPTVAVPPSDRRRSIFVDRLGSSPGDLAMWSAVPHPIGPVHTARRQLPLCTLLPTTTPKCSLELY